MSFFARLLKLGGDKKDAADEVNGGTAAAATTAAPAPTPAAAESRRQLTSQISKNMSRKLSKRPSRLSGPSFRAGQEIDLDELDEPIYIVEDARTSMRMSQDVMETLLAVDEDKLVEMANDELANLCHGKKVPLRTDVAGLEDMIAAQAARVPTRTAVVAPDGRSITFAELDSKAGAIAVRLQELGVGPGVAAAVLVERTVEMFVGMLAVIKAGGAVVPLDPLYPETHITNVLEESETKFVLTVPELRSKIAPSCPAPVLMLTDSYPEGQQKSLACQDDTMALFFTSGTTGRPKGVIIKRSNAVAFMANETWDVVTDTAIQMQASSHCFIGSFNDIWFPMVRGITAVIVSRETLLDAHTFGEFRKKHGITVGFLTPKVLEMYADTAPEVLDGMDVVQFAGEAVRKDAVVKLAGRIPHLQHLYGCTEHTGCITSFEVPAEGLPEDAPRVPIGAPITNCSVLVLDSDLQPVEIGEAGELYVAGPQVTGGYLNRPEETAKKFVDLPGYGRAYRTGDLARWLPGGIDLMGRIDRMVKVGGYRIELGDIETAAMNPDAGLGCTAVAAVLLEKEAQLALYVTPETVDTRAVRRHIKASLPYYSVPAHILAIPALPLSPNGKLDVRTLPPVDSFPPQEASPPVGETEESVAAIFAELLRLKGGAKAVDMEATWAELGGNSLQTVALLAGIQKIAPALQMSDLILADTPRSLSEAVDRLSSVAPLPKELIRLSNGPADGSGKPPIFMIHGALGVRPFGQEMAAELQGKREVYCIEASDAAAEAGDANGIDGIAKYYLDCIRSVQPTGPYAIGGFAMGTFIAFDMVRLLEEGGEEVAEFITIDYPNIQFDGKKAHVTATNPGQRATCVVANSILPERLGIDPAKCEAAKKKLFEQADKIFYDQPGEDPATKVCNPVAMILGYFEEVLGKEEAFVFRHFGKLAQLKAKYLPPQDRNPPVTLKTPIFVIYPEDNTLMAHEMDVVGKGGSEDYCWSGVSTGGIKVVKVPGDHHVGRERESAIALAAALVG